MVIVALAITAVIIWHPWSLEKPSSIPSGKPSLAVMYFENNSGDKGLDYLRDVQLNLLITDLNQSKYISVISQDRIYSILQNLKLDMADKYSSEHLAAISERCGVSNIVTDSYYTPGDRFIFNVSFKKLLVGENVTFTEEGDNVPDIIDSISLRIKSELGLNREQIASDTDEKAGIIRSYSPDALNYFTQGVMFYGKVGTYYDKAIPLLEAAIEADPNRARGDKLDDPKFREHFEKVFALSDSASERERLIIQGSYYLGLKEDYEKADPILHELVEKYPDEAFGYRLLTILHGRLGNTKKQRDYAEKAYRARPESWEEVYNFVNRLFRELELAETVLLDFIERSPEHPVARYYLVRTYRMMGKDDLALSELDKLFQVAREKYTKIDQFG